MMAPKRKKRKKDDADDDWKETKKKKTVQLEGICVIHMDDSKKEGFTYLISKNKTTVVEKLETIAKKDLGRNLALFIVWKKSVKTFSPIFKLLLKIHMATTVTATNASLET